MEWRRGEDLRGEFKRVERGWCLGGEEFRQKLVEQVEARPGPSHFGEAVQEAEAAQAERLVVEGLKRIETLGGSFAALSDLLELDALQIKVARNLCQSRMGIYEVLGASGAGLRLRELVTDCMISRAASKAGRAI